MAKGKGFVRADGVYADVENLVLLPSQTLAAGQTTGAAFDVGDCRVLRCKAQVSAKSGTSPTVDFVLQTSEDGVIWTSAATFRQLSDVTFALAQATETGTTPPNFTFTGTATNRIDFYARCTLGGARGTFEIDYSIDGGGTFVHAVSAATIALPYGVTLNIENASANVDNRWTSRPLGDDRVVAPVHRFARVAAWVGGSSNPTITASIVAQAA